MKSDNNSNTYQNILRLLDGNDALASGSPWPSCNYEKNEMAELDYRHLMSNSDTAWATDLPNSFKEDIIYLIREKIDINEIKYPPTSTNPQETIWDICAWYQPVHFHPTDWGIYIKEDCLLRLAIAIAQATDNKAYAQEKVLSPKGAYWKLGDVGIFVRAAFVLLFLHEHYHHRIECLGIRLHVVTRRSLYVPYINKIYVPAKGTDDLLEEALANACILLRLDEAIYRECLPLAVRNAMKALLKARFPNEPPGYRMAVKYVDQDRFDAGENILQGWVKETTKMPVQSSWEWNAAPRMTQSFLNVHSNIYTVVPKGKNHILPTTYFPYSCSTDQMVAICNSHGYSKVPSGGKGSHIKLTKPGGTPVILPLRKDLSVGVVKNTLASIGGYKLNDLPGLLNSK